MNDELGTESTEADKLHEIIAELRAERSKLRQDLADHKNSLKIARRRLYGVSFLKELESYKDYVGLTSESARYATLPTRGMTYKLRTYEHIASHGIPTPEVYAVWATPDDINFEDLPDSFVLKSDGGSTSKGVLPLLRSGNDSYSVADGTRKLTSAQVRNHFTEAYASGASYGAMFAEQLLTPADGSARIPDDVKVYVAYGRILQVLLRQVDVHGTVSETRSKYVDSQGNDLGAVAGHRRLDPDIPVPETLPTMIEVSRHLSRASGLSFCRVDLYDTTRGVLVGEVTRAPGGAQSYSLEHDREMGRLWNLAKAELTIDIQSGRPARMLWGNHPTPRYYASMPSSLARDREVRETLDCAIWC